VDRLVRTLLFSTLYPSSVRPTHGIFVETRLRKLLEAGGVETRVVAPVPWFPSTAPRWGDYARMAATPVREHRNGIDVRHPRYLVVPKVGMTVTPLLLALAARPAVQALLDDGFDFDLIDAHYYYPDGVAAALLARWFGKPFCVTARGTDLNLIPQHALPRAMIRWASRRAVASIGVCSALMDVLRGWGDVPPERVHVMRNGVDLERFRPLDPQAMRQELGLNRPGEERAPVLLSVGHLIERKGHHLAIDALALLRRSWPRARLVILGEGEERGALERQAARLGLQQAVSLPGAMPNDQLARWYSAADVSILASSREGWANVLLESMACGTPVVATDIWGTPEVVAPASGGKLVAERSGAAFAAALTDLLTHPPARTAVRAYASGFSWDHTSQQQLALFSRMAAAGTPLAACHA
jgi:teichuronic acid biosynthesis glycosyltransferase TuaC